MENERANAMQRHDLGISILQCVITSSIRCHETPKVVAQQNWASVGTGCSRT
jgi:hypothetical protein